MSSLAAMEMEGEKVGGREGASESLSTRRHTGRGGERHGEEEGFRYVCLDNVKFIVPPRLQWGRRDTVDM